MTDKFSRMLTEVIDGILELIDHVEVTILLLFDHLCKILKEFNKKLSIKSFSSFLKDFCDNCC